MNTFGVVMSTSNRTNTQHNNNNNLVKTSNTVRRPLQQLHVNRERETCAEKEKAFKPSNEQFELRPVVSDDNTEIPAVFNNVENVMEPRQDVFRSISAWDNNDNREIEEMWTLKRANPISSEDEDEIEIRYASPSKRCRQLNWDSRLQDDEPFQLFFSG